MGQHGSGGACPQIPVRARAQELEIFDRIDAEQEWPGQPLPPWEEGAVPDWASYTAEQVKAAQEVAQKKPATGVVRVCRGCVPCVHAGACAVRAWHCVWCVCVCAGGACRVCTQGRVQCALRTVCGVCACTPGNVCGVCVREVF